MKKFVLLAGTALILVGCNQGGTGDDYDTETGIGTDSTGSTNYNYQSDQGGATTPGGTITDPAAGDASGMGATPSTDGTNTGSGTSTGEPSP